MKNPFRVITDLVKKSYYTLTGAALFIGQPVTFYRSDNIDSYSVCWLVNTCIDKIAEAVSGVEKKLYKINKKGEIDEIEDHPLLDLLARPNPRMSGFELLESISSFLKIFGEAYILKIRGENTKRILALEVLRPDFVRIFFENDKKKYEYRIGGNVQIFEDTEIIPIIQFNPKDPYHGLATITPLMELIKTIIYTTRYNMNFFHNSAIPGGILVSKTKLRPEEKEEAKKQWEAQYGGWEKAHKTVFFGGTDMDFKVVSPTARDMQFAQLDERNTQNILAAFGVPKAIIGMQGMNRAEAEAQIYTFMRFSILPDVQRIFDKLNEFLVPEFGDNLFLDFENPVPEDREKIIMEYEKAWNRWLSTNEIRDMEGLPPIDGGWSIYIPFGMMPIGEEEPQKGLVIKINPKEYYKHKRVEQQKALRKKILSKLARRKETKLKNELSGLLMRWALEKKKLSYTPEREKELWDEHDKSLTTNTKIFKAMVKTLFKKQKERVKEAVNSAFIGKAINKIKIEIPLDWELEKEIFVEVSKPVFTGIAIEKGKRVADLLGTEFSLTDRMKKYIDKRAKFFAKEVNDTTWKDIAKELKEGIDQNEGASQLATRIDSLYKDEIRGRSERIARTEVVSSSNEATQEIYMETEVVEKKKWVATMDDRVRDSHARMNGEIVDKGEAFSNGLMFPGEFGDPDETINCRCMHLPITE